MTTPRQPRLRETRQYTYTLPRAASEALKTAADAATKRAGVPITPDLLVQLAIADYLPKAEKLFLTAPAQTR